MRLTLRVRSYCDQPPENKQEKSFDEFPVLIGRSPCCQYVLNDVSKYISNNHASVILQQGQLILHDDESANGIYLNGSIDPVGKGNSVPIKNGDTLAIGDYTLTVTVQSESGDEDPFDDFSNGNVGTCKNVQDSDDPFNPFKGEDPDWTPPSSVEDPFETGWGDATKSSSSAEFDWANWDERDNNGDARTATSAPLPGPAAEINDDIDWMPNSSSVTAATPAPKQSPHPAPVPAASARENQPRLTSSGDSAVNTFIRAARLNPPDFAHLSEDETMQQVGTLLNQSIEGIMLLLESRSKIKDAIRADVTRLSRSNNNPLKFSNNAEEALTRLLVTDTARGYQTSDKAITEAVDDLKAHHLAMLDGMKAAVWTVLKQFEPKILEHKLDKANPLTANIPINRQVKLWQLFQDKYEDIREEAVSDFDEMFRKEFRKAYETRLRELDKEPDF